MSRRQSNCAVCGQLSTTAIARKVKGENLICCLKCFGESKVKEVKVKPKSRPCDRCQSRLKVYPAHFKSGTIMLCGNCFGKSKKWQVRKD